MNESARGERRGRRLNQNEKAETRKWRRELRDKEHNQGEGGRRDCETWEQ